MNKKTTIAIGLFLIVSIPGVAQEAAVQEPSMFSGPNAALAIVAVVQLIAILGVVGILKRITHNPKYFLKLREFKKSQSAKTILVTGLFLGAAKVGSAQTAAPEFPAFFDDPNTVLLLCLNLLLLGVFLYVTSLLKRTVAMLMPELEKKPEPETKKAPESSFMHALTDAVPIEREHEVMTDHEYDGIRELDNNLPPWWVWMFNLSIVFAVVYLVYFHVLPYGMSQEEEYLAEVEQAEIEKQEYLALMKDR
ncbi:MAG TPA: cbb3-type cytochrome c oxidase N-terminal domain-containing protein, partial [Cryomorphaceae bacterium]|nr:cbb3-type cytochrome c oxidase N-terminal domain-containing protein [Cryomorphaceae bacterium]